MGAVGERGRKRERERESLLVVVETCGLERVAEPAQGGSTQPAPSAIQSFSLALSLCPAVVPLAQTPISKESETRACLSFYV